MNSKPGRILLLCAGLALCGWLFRQVDPESVAEHFRKLGGWLPLVLVPYFGVYLSDTMGWRLSFGRRGPGPVGYLAMVRIRWCGESLNNLIPSAYVGGEALKVFLLRQRGVDAADSTAAAVVSKCIQTLAQILFVAGASIAFSHLLPPESPVRHGLRVVTVGSLAVAAGMLWIQAVGVFRVLMRAASWTGLTKRLTPERQARLRDIDATISGFYRSQPRWLLGSLLFYLGGWLGDTLEIWLFAALLGTPISWFQALSIEAFVGVAKIMGMFVPGAMGIQESGIVFLGRAAGLGEPLCVSYAVFRRLRELLFIAIGFSLLSLQGVTLGDLRRSSASKDQAPKN